MIKSNEMPSSPDGNTANANLANKPSPPPRATSALKRKPLAPNKKLLKPKSSSGGIGFLRNTFYFALFLVMALVIYMEFVEIPEFLEDRIPPQILSWLGLDEQPAGERVKKDRDIAPAMVAQGYNTAGAQVPANGAVEEIIKTVRPDVFYKDRVLTEYKDQILFARIPYQKQAFHIMLSTFYDATPDGVGFLDLAYQAPNFYFARAVSVDTRTYTVFLEHLKTRTTDLSVSDSATLSDGTFEFSVFGGVRSPEGKFDNSFELTPPAKIRDEISALRSLALRNQVTLVGIDKPREERFSTYRRIMLRVSTDADYPSLLNFAQALQKSNSNFGVQKFSSQPHGSEKIRSTIEFVMYASAK